MSNSNSRTPLTSDGEGNFWTRLASTTRAAIVGAGILVLVAIILGVTLSISTDENRPATTTIAPSTVSPTDPTEPTVSPTTAAPTPEPTTAQPTTAAPTTAQPTTAQPTTAQPTTAQPTTAAPTTAQPTTEAPTSEPTTAQPTTAAPTTAQPTTAQPTTAQPTTAQPTTAAPTTVHPTTEAPTPEPTSPSPPEPTPEPVSVCLSEVCNRTSEMMRANMDTSRNPCDNFYEYACGNFDKNHKMPEDKGRFTSFDMIGEEVKQLLTNELSKPSGPNEARPLTYVRQFFQKCSDEESLKKENLRALEGLVRSVAVDKSSKEEFIASAVTQTVPTLISVKVGSDPSEPKKRMLQLDQPTFAVSKQDLVADQGDTKAAAIREAYTNFIKSGMMLYEPELKVEEATERAKNVVNLDIALAKIAAKDEDRRNMSDITKRVAIDKLAEEVKGIKLDDIVKTFLGLGKMDASEVIVVDIKYMMQLGQVLDNNKAVLSDYHTWKVIEGYGGLLSEKFTDAQFDFLKVKNGIEKKPDQKEICINTLVNYVPSVIGRVYIDAAGFTDEDKKDAEEMIARIQQSMEKIINEKEWMDEETKKRGVDKLHKMTVNIAYPEWIRDDEALTKSFPPRPLGKDSSFNLLVKMRGFLIKDSVSKLNEEIDFDREWPMSPALVNAAYDPGQNSITFPAAILRGVFYEPGRPDYCNYGGVGGVIGHEITHGFDDQGAQYDALGRLNNWWSQSTLKNFVSLTELIVKQYSDIVDTVTGLHLNGQNTQGENIADNGGVREAYSALFEHAESSNHPALVGMESFSPEKMFFLSQANLWCSLIRPDELRQRINTDPHSPSQYRVNVPFMNFEKFAQAFSCSGGSPMNPDNKVRVW